MLLQPVGNTNPNERFHVPPGIGKALILTGTVEEVRPEVKSWQPMRWTLGFADYGEGAPIIHYNCPNDGCTAKAGRIESATGKAHLKAISHCAGTELPPAAVVEKYKDAWARYARKHSIQEARKPRYSGVKNI
jgi:hypothetical protein